MVIRYAYLWVKEFDRGLEEGSKDHPCTILLAVKADDGEQIVTVLPITHSPHQNPEHAIEIPAATKRRLDLMMSAPGLFSLRVTVSFGQVPIFGH